MCFYGLRYAPHKGLRQCVVKILNLFITIFSLIYNGPIRQNILKVQVHNLNREINLSLIGDNSYNSIVGLVIECEFGCEDSCHNSTFMGYEIEPDYLLLNQEMKYCINRRIN